MESVSKPKTSGHQDLHAFYNGLLAVRLNKGETSLHSVTTANGFRFTLLNLPYFLTSKVQDYLEAYSEGKLEKL